MMDKEEMIILKSQGTIQNRMSWHLGHLHLTGNQLFFMQVKKNLFMVSLDRIIRIDILKRAWMLGCRVKQLCIVYQGQRGEECVYIALSDPEKWVHTIKKTIALRQIERWNHNATEQEPTNNT